VEIGQKVWEEWGMQLYFVAWACWSRIREVWT